METTKLFIFLCVRAKGHSCGGEFMVVNLIVVSPYNAEGQFIILEFLWALRLRCK